jgi:hypothetical protein
LIAVRDLFESHLNVADLQRSMSFFGQTLGLELAEVIWNRRVAFYWIGGRGNSMLGLWEVGTSPQRLSLHIAFRSDLSDLVYIVMGAVGFAYHAGDFRLRPVETDLVLVETVWLLAVVAGVCMLRAQNWAQWLALAWMAFHVVLSVFHSWGQALVDAVFLAAMAYFLFRPGVNEYFRGGRPEAS